MHYTNVAGQKEILSMGCGSIESGEKEGCFSMDEVDYEIKCSCMKSKCVISPPKAYQAIDENSLPIMWGIRQLKAHMDKVMAEEKKRS